MRTVYCIGETVYDVIFKNEKPVEARPGGAMLNTAVSLGRLNIPVCLIGDFGNDKVGEIISTFLTNNNVSTQYLIKYSDGRSRLALAFLDDHNNAAYSFYKIKKTEKAKLSYPELKENDIVLFGSFYGIKDEIREDLVEFLKYARKSKSIIIYDPNFRNAHLNILEEVADYINENFAYSDVVKGSDEDFQNIFKLNNAKDTFPLIQKSNQVTLIYTANSKGVWLKNNNLERHFFVPLIQPVSTIGAGDTFNAGLIYGLLKYNITYDEIHSMTERQWGKIISIAIRFAQHCCMSYDNYLEIEFAKKILES